MSDFTSMATPAWGHSHSISTDQVAPDNGHSHSMTVPDRQCTLGHWHDNPGAKNPNPKDRVGCNKVPMGLVPEIAIAEEALAMLEGNLKYGAWNYIGAEAVRSSVYVDACKRHLAKWENGEDRDQATGVHHLAYARACGGILLAAEAAGTLIDDRPPADSKISARLDELAKTVVRIREMFKDSKPRHYTIADTK